MRLSVVAIWRIFTVLALGASCCLGQPSEPLSYYKLQLDFSTTSDWTRLVWTDSPILAVRELDRTGEIGFAGFVSESSFQLSQSGVNAERGNAVTVTLEIAIEADKVSNPLDLKIQKGYLNGSSISALVAVDGNRILLDEDTHDGVTSDPGELNEKLISLSVDGVPRTSEVTVQLPAESRKTVLAFYYPWWSVNGWRQRQWLKDIPSRPYDSVDREVIARQIDEARSAGIDGFICSWVGVDWYAQSDEVLRMLLDVAQEKDFLVSVYFETMAQFDASGTRAQPEEKLLEWLEFLFDNHAYHPAFLTREGRPVIFVWAAGEIPLSSWQNIFSSLESRGNAGYYHGASNDARLLGVFDAIHNYAVAESESLPVLAELAAPRIRNYFLLHEDARPTVTTATVQPGYDEELQPNRFGRVMDRENGSLYARSWEQALESAPDWILVSTWNEFLEHTHVEPSEVFGDQYLRITRDYVAEWKPDYPLVAAGAVVNAADYSGAAVAPGELVTIFGRSIGPEQLVPMILTDGGRSASTEIAGVKVYFDGVAAPLVFAREDQVAAVVPPSGVLRDRTLIEVEHKGQRAPGIETAVRPHSPGIFTLDSTGKGQAAAILHSDATINGPDNPATRGSVVTIFGTGGGTLQGAGWPGDVARSIDRIAANVTATIGGVPAEVLYAGTAPGLLRSVFQANLRIARETPVGDAVPLILSIGDVNSQASVTLAIMSLSGLSDAVPSTLFGALALR